MQFVRFAVVGFVLLTVIYVLISIYSRSVRRERLEDDWAELDEEARAGQLAVTTLSRPGWQRIRVASGGS